MRNNFKDMELGRAIAKMYIAAQEDISLHASNMACAAMENANKFVRFGFNAVMKTSPYQVRAESSFQTNSFESPSKEVKNAWCMKTSKDEYHSLSFDEKQITEDCRMHNQTRVRLEVVEERSPLMLFLEFQQDQKKSDL